MKGPHNYKFEFPYNFDKQLINILQGLKVDKEIHCFYIPPFPEDYEAVFRSDNSIRSLHNLTREEYEDHIKNIHACYPNKMQLILQREKLMDVEMLQYYINLGFTKFCVRTIEQAKLIKSLSNDYEVIGSIVMKITPQQLKENLEYKKYFDGFVIFFSYNKNIDALNDFPDDYFYVLLIGSYCHTQCDGLHHWDAEKKYVYKNLVKCPKSYKSTDWEYMTTICPWDLSVFKDKISIYKIQGREFTTYDIISEFMMDTAYYKIYPNMEPNINRYKRSELFKNS